MKFSLKIILFLSLFISSLTAQENDKITLQLQWKHQFEFAGFYAAKEKGFYKEVGLDVELREFQQNMNVIDEVLTGKVDYGLTYSSLIAEYMQGKPLVFVANFFKQSPLVLVTTKDIHTPEDLKGKKISSSHLQIILAMLSNFHLTTKDFKYISRDFNIQSFIDKKVDAIGVFSTNEIYTLNKLGVQYNIVDPAVFGTKFYDQNLFTSKSELQNHPQRVENFRKASIKGWEYALKHKEEILNLIMQKYNTQKKSKEAFLFEANQIEYLMLTNVYPIGSIDLERVQMIADSYAQSLSIAKKNIETFSSFIYTPIKNFTLSSKEKNYLQKKKILKMCVDPNWMPLDKILDGRHIGVFNQISYNLSLKKSIPLLNLLRQNRGASHLQK